MITLRRKNIRKDFTCAICGKENYKRRMCEFHYISWRNVLKYGSKDVIKQFEDELDLMSKGKCKHNDCCDPIVAKNMCKKHYARERNCIKKGKGK